MIHTHKRSRTWTAQPSCPLPLPFPSHSNPSGRLATHPGSIKLHEHNPISLKCLFKFVSGQALHTAVCGVEGAGPWQRARQQRKTRRQGDISGSHGTHTRSRIQSQCPSGSDDGETWLFLQIWGMVGIGKRVSRRSTHFMQEGPWHVMREDAATLTSPRSYHCAPPRIHHTRAHIGCDGLTRAEMLVAMVGWQRVIWCGAGRNSAIGRWRHASYLVIIQEPEMTHMQ